MGETPDIPDECLNDNHDFDQGGRCRRCGMDRADTTHHGRRTGGAGVRRSPATDEEARKEIRNLER